MPGHDPGGDFRAMRNPLRADTVGTVNFILSPFSVYSARAARIAVLRFLELTDYSVL